MAVKSANWYIRVLLGLLFVGVIAFYTVLQSEDFARGPEITILSPEGGILLSEPEVEVRGVAERVNEITLNGNSIFIDESGAFNETILLVPGINIITIEAQDKFERRVTETLELLYK
jgi:hypothetical protein